MGKTSFKVICHNIFLVLLSFRSDDINDLIHLLIGRRKNWNFKEFTLVNKAKHAFQLLEKGAWGQGCWSEGAWSDEYFH